MELVLDRVSKQYSNRIAVDRQSVTFTPGVIGLLGANGAGKTTLMRMICGILKPTSGTVCFKDAGEELDSSEEMYRDALGYLPQDFGYYPNFTGRDFLMYMAALKGIEKRAAKRRDYKQVEITKRHTMVNTLAYDGVFGSHTESVIRTLLAAKLENVFANKFEIVVGLNTRTIIPPREIDIPIIFIRKVDSTTYKFAIEVDDYDEEKYKGQSIMNIVENMKHDCIDKVITDFCIFWYASKDDVMYAATHYRNGEIPNESAIKATIDFTSYKAATENALPKFKYYAQMILALRKTLDDEIKPLITQ